MRVHSEIVHLLVPWVSTALLIITFVLTQVKGHIKKKDQDESQLKPENYGVLGLFLGMGIGCAISAPLHEPFGVCMTLGMLLGLILGSLIKKNGKN